MSKKISGLKSGDFRPLRINMQLFPLGVFIVALKYICLSFATITPDFYFNYIDYFDLLIFCCQNVARVIIYPYK